MVRSRQMPSPCCFLPGTLVDTKTFVLVFSCMRKVLPCIRAMDLCTVIFPTRYVEIMVAGPGSGVSSVRGPLEEGMSILSQEATP